jgi:DNA-binding response OmpR family regulator
MTARPRVLVVDDDDLAGSTVVRILERSGYEVCRDRTIAGARTSIADWRPDVVVLDRRLPDGDGLSLARSVHKEHERPRLIVMTGDVLTAAEQRCVDAYLQKPADVRSLLAAVDG